MWDSGYERGLLLIILLFLICRRCNCDVGDDKVRYDAGIMRFTKDLPLSRFMTQQREDGCYAKLTLGNIYCAEEKLGKLNAEDIVEVSYQLEINCIVLRNSRLYLAIKYILHISKHKTAGSQ